MTKINPRDILRRLEDEGFEETWVKTSEKMLDKQRGVELVHERGKVHPIFEATQKLREAYLDLGFTEVLNPVIVDETEVYRQYGPEAAVILDRCYYLAGLPRPDIGLSREKFQRIEQTGVSLSDAKQRNMKRVLRGYKKGEIDADDLIEEMASALGTTDLVAIRILQEAFPELEKLSPVPSTLTLRSHITSSWFRTIEALQKRAELPLKLFTVDSRFRREQKEDADHLRVHRAASGVVVDEEVSVEDGKAITEAVLSSLDIGSLRHMRKKVTSKYYAVNTEHEVFAHRRAGDSWIEVANFGMYSPISLARYGIEYPVLNIGIGVERVAMVLFDEVDVRRLAFPQFYREWIMSDEDLARSVKIALKPKTKEGKRLLEAVVSTAIDNADKPSPCEVLAYSDSINNLGVEVTVFERDEGVALLGPAALNTVYVYDGNVVGIPPRGLDKEPIVKAARERGYSTGIRYIDSIASLAAHRIEDAALKGESGELIFRVRVAKLPSDLNIELSEAAQHYVTSRNRVIDLRGPVFVGIRAQIA